MSQELIKKAFYMIRHIEDTEEDPSRVQNLDSIGLVWICRCGYTRTDSKRFGTHLAYYGINEKHGLSEIAQVKLANN